MSVQSNKSWRTAVAMEHTRPSRGDPVLQIGSTLKSLYLMDDADDIGRRFSNCLDRLDHADAKARSNDH